MSAAVSIVDRVSVQRGGDAAGSGAVTGEEGGFGLLFPDRRDGGLKRGEMVGISSLDGGVVLDAGTSMMTAARDRRLSGEQDLHCTCTFKIPISPVSFPT